MFLRCLSCLLSLSLCSVVVILMIYSFPGAGILGRNAPLSRSIYGNHFIHHCSAPPCGPGGGCGLNNYRSRTRKFRKGHEEHRKWNCREGATQAESESTKALTVVRIHNLKSTPLENAIEPLMDIISRNWDRMNPTKVSTCCTTDALITKNLVLI